MDGAVALRKDIFRNLLLNADRSILTEDDTLVDSAKDGSTITARR